MAKFKVTVTVNHIFRQRKTVEVEVEAANQTKAEKLAMEEAAGMVEADCCTAEHDETYEDINFTDRLDGEDEEEKLPAACHTASPIMMLPGA